MELNSELFYKINLTFASRKQGRGAVWNQWQFALSWTDDVGYLVYEDREKGKGKEVREKRKRERSKEKKEKGKKEKKHVQIKVSMGILLLKT